MSHLTVVEAQVTKNLDLTTDEALRLNQAGRRLVGTAWWGNQGSDGEAERSVVSCHEGVQGWDVNAQNVVGAIGLGTRTLHITPKIPIRHLMYLFGQAGALPRLDDAPVEIKVDTDYVTAVAIWFLTTVHQLIRLGLRRDYHEVEEETMSLQGQLLIPETTIGYYSGRPRLTCRFDDFVFDNPPNRVLKEALIRVSQIPGLEDEPRRQARGLLAELPPVGELKYSDLRYRPDRNAQRYSEPLELARQLIEGTGRRPDPGTDASVGFLIPTPSNVEEGIRRLLQSRLLPERLPQKRKWNLEGGVALEPDLVFGSGVAVGDVKYRLYEGKWKRSEVFQLTTYAAAARCSRALLIGFSRQVLDPYDLVVGNHRLRLVTWAAADSHDPEGEAQRLVDAVADFIDDDTQDSVS
jgi:5-methylcytosine-specific restriction enzyme subunit McrC